MATTSYVDFTAAVRGIGARTNAAGSAVSDITAEEDRLIQALIAEGAITTNAFKVQATTGMTLTVGSGVAKTDLYAVAGEASGQGIYLCRLEAATVNVTVPAADATARTDEIYLVVADAPYDSGTVSLPRIGYRKGTAGGGAPGVDTAWKASVKLATVAVGGSVSSIVSGNITDNRASSTLALLTTAADPRYLGASAKAADSELLDGLDSTAFVRNSTVQSATVSTAETTTSGTFTDLATSGPAVTLTTGTRALVTVSAEMFNSGVGLEYMGFAVTGASTVAANDDDTVGASDVALTKAGCTILVTGLTAGSNTFTAKYRAGSGTATFGRRRITVIPL